MRAIVVYDPERDQVIGTAVVPEDQAAGIDALICGSNLMGYRVFNVAAVGTPEGVIEFMQSDGVPR